MRAAALLSVGLLLGCASSEEPQEEPAAVHEPGAGGPVARSTQPELDPAERAHIEALRRKIAEESRARREARRSGEAGPQEHEQEAGPDLDPPRVLRGELGGFAVGGARIEREGKYWSVSGQVQNNSGQTWAYAELSVEFYDHSRTRIDVVPLPLGAIAGGEVRPVEVSGPKSEHELHSVRFVFDAEGCRPASPERGDVLVRVGRLGGFQLVGSEVVQGRERWRLALTIRNGRVARHEVEFTVTFYGAGNELLSTEQVRFTAFPARSNREHEVTGPPAQVTVRWVHVELDPRYRH